MEIPFHRPSIGEEEIQEVVTTLRSGWLTSGPRTVQFEEEFREYVQAKHALAVNSATAGLHLALTALGIGPGDEVITTPLTFCSTVHSIIHTGATPVLADVKSNGNLDPASVEKLISPRTKAILPVHLAGLPCNMDRIWAMARARGLFVVEDAAHAVGARYYGRPIGASSQPASDAVVFSFYATKNLATGEGGMVTTPRADLADAMKMLTLHGMSRDAWGRYTKEGSWYYEVLSDGFKYNLSDLQSAIGIHQLRKLDGFTQTRAEYAQLYTEAFSHIEELESPPDECTCTHAWHLYILRLRPEKAGLDRNDFIEALRKKGITCSVHFIPIPLHPYFSKLGLTSDTCPRAMELYSRIVSLPLYPAMRKDQVRYVARSVVEVIEGARDRSPLCLR